MKELLNQLQKKKDYYEKIVEQTEESLSNAPKEGKIRVVNCRGVEQYYIRLDKSDTNGKYLPVKEHYIAKQIAQRDYDKKVNKCAKRWSKLLGNLIKSAPMEDLKDIYQKSDKRKKLINPYEITNQEYARQWLRVQYKGKRFDENIPEIYTEKGERVRSKSEKIIADKLYMMGIPYRYEYPLKMAGVGTVYPDFTILKVSSRREIVLEHFGMMDNPDYCEKALRKINSYAKNGYILGDNLLVTFESSTIPLDARDVQKMMEKHIKMGGV